MKKNSPATSEKLTRNWFIDRRLIEAGWRIVPERDFDSSKPLRDYERCAIEEYPTDHGPSDYVLCADGKILGVGSKETHAPPAKRPLVGGALRHETRRETLQLPRPSSREISAGGFSLGRLAQDDT